ncbi:MAG: NnrU family protein [Gammaproteobacteria bacterium]|nr:NnrU family protein [Gammaproteobacteria bacterium]
MPELFAASAAWLLTHLGLSGSPLRAVLVRRIGEGPYRGLYSLIAVGALAWLILAWAGVPQADAPRTMLLWESAGWLRWIPVLIMPLALILLVGGLSGPNPTAVGQERQLGAGDSVRGVLRITRHPVQWAILLWALTHLAANGDAATLLFTATIGLTSALGMALIDRRKASDDPAAWSAFAAASSALPFAAIASGRNRLAIGEIGVLRIAAALVLYGLAFHFHRWIAGVPVVLAG